MGTAYAVWTGIGARRAPALTTHHPTP
nr:hypothetical protein [Pseudomonas mandelii]